MQLFNKELHIILNNIRNIFTSNINFCLLGGNYKSISKGKNIHIVKKAEKFN
jgi:hypothetical protein